MKLLVNLQYDFEYEGFVVDCPSLPGCMSQGKTRKDKERQGKTRKDKERGIKKYPGSHSWLR